MSALLEAAAESRVVAGLRARIAQLEAVLHDYVQSDEERGLWFGVLGMAYANWPEQYDFQPDDAEHLRHWALIEIGFCDTLEIDGAMPHEAIIRIGLAFSHGKKHFRLARSGGGYLLRIPRSMKKGTSRPKSFAPWRRGSTV